jgi:hypothetical protein
VTGKGAATGTVGVVAIGAVGAGLDIGLSVGALVEAVAPSGRLASACGNDVGPDTIDPLDGGAAGETVARGGGVPCCEAGVSATPGSAERVGCAANYLGSD